MSVDLFEITEIGSLASEGMTEPRWCFVDENGESVQYVVKHANAGKQTLVNEWVSAWVANEMHLPIPRHALVYCSFNVAAANPSCHASYYHQFPGFGSRAMTNSIAYNGSVANQTPLRLRQKIFWFDWFMQNGDRTEGNPNLLWVPADQEMLIIDHNLAFNEDETSLSEFTKYHVFGPDVVDYKTERIEEIESDFHRIMHNVVDVIEQMPAEWSEDWNTTFEGIHKAMNRIEDSGFWNVR